MAIDLYDLATMDAIYTRQRAPATPFFLPNFTRQINFTTPEIMFDKVFGDDRGLAPFVLPTAMGRPQKLNGYETVRFKPAYAKIKDVVDPTMHVERLPGEAPIVGQFSIQQRRDIVKAELLRMQKVKFQNRNEWLAARAIIDGEVTIAGEGYPSTLVDFRRDNSLTIVKAGTAKWSNVAANPLADLKAARILVNELTGDRVTKIVMGQGAWDYFAARVDLKELQNNNYRSMDANRVVTMADGFAGWEYMGVIQDPSGGGRMEFWVHTDKYIDPETGTKTLYLDTNTVVGIGDVQGVRCFGAIMDAGAMYEAREVFFKNWENQDPSHEYIMGQSAPLMVPKVPDSTFSILVHS